MGPQSEGQVPYTGTLLEKEIFMRFNLLLVLWSKTASMAYV